jgi:hypothetical protein
VALGKNKLVHFIVVVIVILGRAIQSLYAGQDRGGRQGTADMRAQDDDDPGFMTTKIDADSTRK